MITVQLSGTALTVRGHAGFSRYGSDIVCAAASMLAFTLAAAMEEAGLQRAPEIESACGSFRIAVRPREGERARVEAVFAAIGAGYRLLAARYPEYVRVMDEDSPENSRQRPEDGPENGQKEEKDGETGMAAGVRRAGAAGDRRGGTHAGAAGAAGGAFAGGHAGADAGAARGGDAAGLCAAEGAVCRGAGGLSAGGAEPGAGGSAVFAAGHARCGREERL
ncbi:MAG: ribosomal-processing cysteine protease Prp [Oscillospiraceae bacterium]|nr:ribosomal-processing cysteine protease Prp [Oscillospiraceae bacterium]